MAYENLKQTVNDYEKESINIADDTYNQLTAQMDKTLADIDAFLKTGKEDAATRAAFETAEGNLQSEKLKSSVKTDTAKIMGSAGAGVRSGMAKDTLKKANREYDITSKKAKADIGAYKANAALNISSQKLDVYQNSANMKSDAAAQAYEQIMNDRQFEYKKEQNAIDNALANQKLELDKQQFEFQKQKLENEKMAAAIGVATNLIQETTIENPETGEKETVQYYDFDQNGEMSAAERSLYVEDKGQRNYLNALKSIGMATSVDEISQSLYKMQTDLFGSGIDRVTGEIASWDNYSGFNDEYAKQLYMNFGLTDAEATEMMHEAKAMCFLNNYAKGDGSVVFGTRNADGTYANEEFYRNGLKETGISDDRVDYYLDIMKKNWDSSLDSVNEIKQEIYNAESRQQEIDKEIDSIIPTLNAQKGYEYYWGLVNEQKSLQNQLILIGQSGQYSQEADNLQKRYAEVTNEINKINNRFSGVDLNNKTMSQEYAKADPAYDQVENLRNEKNNLTTLKNQYKDTYWFYTDGSQYGIIDKILSDKIGREKLDDFVGKVTSMMELDQIAAPQILALFTQDKAVGEAVKSVFGEENLQENLVGYLKWCSVLGQQEAMETDYLDGTGVGWKAASGISSAIGRLFLSLQAGLANFIEGGVDIWEENNQSLDEYTPNIKSFYQMADLKLQLIQEEASEAMYEINPVWGFIYSTGVSLAQNAATLGIAVAANLILPGAGSAVSAMLMSANSFNDTYNSVRMDGGSASQALTMGIISGAAEYVFEKLSIGKLLDTPAAKGAGKAFWKSMAKASLADMGFNAMEEMNTEIANVIGEVLVLDNLSEYEKQKQYYMNVEGKTDDVAAALAFRDQVGRVLLAGGQGAIAGGVMGGTIARVKMAKAESKVGKAVQKSGNVSSMIKQGLNANADSEAYKIASQLNEKIKNKGKVSNQEVGALARAIAAETQAASAGLSGVDDGISTVSKETALSNVSSGKVSVSDINTFMPGNEDARAYFKEQTGIELSNNPKTAFAQIVEYVATKTGKTAEQVASELLSNAETSVDVTQKTIASLKSSGNETNVKVAEAFEFLNSEDGVRMLEMQKNNQQPSNGTDAELYQQMLTAKQVIENNRGALEQSGYEIGTVDFNGIDVPVVVPKGYSDNARAEAIKYVNEQAKTEPQKAEKTNSEKAKATQVQSKDSVKADSQSKSTKTKSDSQADTGNAKIKKRTITKKNGDTTVIREKETTSKNKAFKKAKQVSRVETVGKTSARYDYTEVDTSNIYDSEMMDEINVAKEIAKAAGAKNIVFISGDVYIDGKKVRAQGFHSIGGTIFVNVDKSSLYARTIGHEVYHQIRQTNKAGLKAYEDIVRNIIEKGESSEFDFGQRVLSSRRAKEIIDAYKNNDSTMSKDALFEEVCAEFAGEIMTNPVVARALAAADTRAGNAFLRMAKKILAKIQGKENLSDYYNQLSDVEKALVDGIRSNSMTKSEQKAEEKAREATKEVNEAADPKNLMQIEALEEDYSMYEKMLLDSGYEKTDQAMEFLKEFASLIKESDKDLFDYKVKDMNKRIFMPVKNNSDPLYKYSIDFSTLCKKRLLLQSVTETIQKDMNKIMTKEEMISARMMLESLRNYGMSIDVACAICYVESARLRALSQTKKFIDGLSKTGYDNPMVQYYFKHDEKLKAIAKNASETARVKMGLDKNMPKKEMTSAQKKKVRVLEREVYNIDMLSKEQRAVVDMASKWTADRFSSASELESLKENYPEIYTALVSTVAAGSKSKATEIDTIFRAGDLDSLPSNFIKEVNKENGLRMDSWSDFQFRHIADYVSFIYEATAKKAKVHLYAKVPALVDLLGDTNAMMNMSLITTKFKSGDSLDSTFDSKEGIDFNEAIRLRNAYPDNAGTIAVSINDEHLSKLLSDDRIDYVIPYHASGLSKATRTILGLISHKDYTKYQSEKSIAKNNDNEAPKFSEWYNADKAIGITEKFKKIKDANEFKTEYEKLFGKKPNIEFKKTTIFPAQIAMEYMSEKYKALCAERGFYPKFYDVVIDGVRVSDTAGYWKTLIDRKMINNKTGDIIVQKPVEPNFDIERIHGLMQQELQDQKVRSRDERIAKDLLVGFFKSDFYKLPSTNIQARAQVEVFNEKVKAAMGEGSIYDVPKSLFDNAPTTKFQLEDSKGFEQIRHLYDTVTDEEYSMISEWLKEFDKKHGDQNLYGIVNALEEKTFASIIKVIDNAKLFNKEAMSFFKDNFDVAYINMETYDNATAYLLDYAGEKLNDVSSRIAGIDTEEPSYRALVEQISRDVMETGIGASQSTRDDIFNYIVKKSKKDMANEAKQYEKLSKFFAENKLIANQDTLSVGNTILSMNGTTIDDYYKSLQREFGKEMFPNLSGDKGKVDQIKYYVGMVDDYNISKTILGGKDIDIYNAYVRTVVNDAIDTTEKNMMYAYRIATEPKMAQKDFDAYKLYRQALAEGASGILSLNQKRDDIKSQIKRIEYGSSLSPQAREYLTLVRKNGKKQVSTSNNREAIKEIYSISKKLIDLYDQLGRADRAITRTLKGRKSAMYTFIKSLIRNPNQYRNLNRAHASLISLENIIDLTMGADAQMFKDIIVAQYSENESARLRALNMYRVPAADAINKYNIDPNSERGIKIGSVIQLLGEGIIVEKDGKYEISKTAPRDMIYYTDKKGGKGFLQSISKEQFNGLKEVESTGLKGKVEKAVSSKTKDRIRERMVDLNEYVNSISNEDMIAVREISSAMSGVYEDLYRSLTDTLIRNGYPPIKHRANYFPHYIKDGMSTAETIADFVSSFTAGDLPTGVDGNTRDRKPGKKWFGNLLERTGDSTTVNAFVGFDKYLNGASHVIYHTEDIQLRRAAADMLGNKIEMEKLETLYALDTIFDSNDDRREAEGLMEGMRKRLHDDPTYNNTIVTALTRNANAIAGKTTNLDRDFGDIFGRNVLQSIEKFYRFVGRGMVGFNLRSALTNLITIPQLTGTVKMTNIAKAIRDVAQYDALRARNETMEFLESNSSFLYNRVYSQHGKKYSKGYIKDTSQNLSDKNGLWQKYNNAAFAFMNLSDSYTAKVVTAAYYNEAIDRGMTGVQAERFASEGARKLMASRVKGEMPQIFNNRVLGIFTMFQLENSNMFRFLTSDIASYAGTGSGRVGRIIRRLAAFFISEALFEYLLEMLTGSNYRVFSFNPITLVADASAGKKNAMDIMKDLAADIPFVGGLVGEGGRYATSSVIDTWRDLLSSTSKKGIIEFLTGRLSKADYVDISTKLISVLPIAGAGQAKKTIQGIADLSRGGRFGPYTTTNDDGSKSYDEKLYYAIDQEDPANFRAILFGRSSVKEANEYWNSGLGPLSVQATEGYKEAVNAGMKNTKVYKVYRDVSVLRSEVSAYNKENPNNKRNANSEVKKLIRALDATNEQKEILWKNLTTLKNYGSVFSD